MGGATLAIALPLAVAVAFAGCTTAGLDGSGDGLLGVGDTWTLEVTSHEQGDDPYTITLTQAVVARALRNGTDAFEVETAFAWPKEFERPGRTFERTETEWLRVGDLARIERVARTTSVLFASEYPDEAGTYRSESTTVYTPPCANLVAAPLEVGSAWTATCTSHGASTEHDRDGKADRHEHSEHDVTRYDVEARETLRVRAGTFEVHRVASTTHDPRPGDDSASATAWVAQGPCPPVPVLVESTYENEEHGGTSRIELVALSC